MNNTIKETPEGDAENKSVSLLRKIIELKPGGESRPQQEEAVRIIDSCLKSKTNLLLEAPTGSGKTLSYLTPVIQAGKRAVISTATKQLSEQIVDVDIAFLSKSLKQIDPKLKINAQLLKGRDNYLCIYKLEEMKKLDKEASGQLDFGSIDTSGLSETATKIVEESQDLLKWTKKTDTGDRSHAPTTSDTTWKQYSSTNAECPGRAACPFGAVCFAEKARDKAVEADIVVTNHAIVALDLEMEESMLLGERDVFIFDELHELDNYLSNAWGGELTLKKLEGAYKIVKNVPSIDAKHIAALEKLVESYHRNLSTVAAGLLDADNTSRALENYLTEILSTTTNIVNQARRKAQETDNENLKRTYMSVTKTFEEIATTMLSLTNRTPEMVRWVQSTENKWLSKEEFIAKKRAEREGKTEKGSPLSIHASPLRVGPKLQTQLEMKDAHMIGMSATVTVQGGFKIPLHNFDLENKPHETLILDTPFDFTKQAMLYVPSADRFPEPVGRGREAHTAAVKTEMTEFIRTSKGRALVLSTTSAGVADYVEHFRKELPHIRFIAQGEGTNAQVVEEFKEDEESVLVGTMGFWHGLDAPGPALTLLLIDKLPFPTPDDPLLTARKKSAELNGRNGFMEIYTTIADNMARQAFGRAIRSKTDRAVIGFFDPRLLTKNYGRGILNNMFGVGIFTDKKLVLDALGRLIDKVERDKDTK